MRLADLSPVKLLLPAIPLVVIAIAPAPPAPPTPITIRCPTQSTPAPAPHDVKQEPPILKLDVKPQLHIQF
jgi:hypothetical protein